MKILKVGKWQALKMTVSVVLIVFLALVPISFVYGQDGVQARVGSQGSVVVSTEELNVRVVPGPVPHFWYWSTDGNQDEAYHVIFLQLIEYSDSDGDEEFDVNERVAGDTTYGLSSGDWEFSGFTTEDGVEIPPGETADTVKFTFTLVGSKRGGGGDKEPGPPTSTQMTLSNLKVVSDNLKIVLTCHINSDDGNKMKIDVYIENWDFASSENRLAIRTDFSSDKEEDTIEVGSGGFQIGEAFLSYENSATADDKSVTVTANSEEKTEETGLKVWFNYPSFENYVDHDPTIGICDLSAETGTDGGFEDGTGTAILSSSSVIGVSTAVVIATIVAIIYIGKRK